LPSIRKAFIAVKSSKCAVAVRKTEIGGFLNSAMEEELKLARLYAEQAKLFEGEPKRLLERVSKMEENHARIIQEMISKLLGDSIGSQ
jgi:rubrerythrin